MIALGHFLNALGGMLHTVIITFQIVLLAYVILSWVSPDPSNPIVRFINGACEPVLARIRGKIPPLGMLDLSPIFAFLALYFLDQWLVASLQDYGLQMVMQAKAAGRIPPAGVGMGNSVSPTF